MTDKEIMKGFQEQFNTGRLFTESNVLVLMGYARGDARSMIKAGLPTDDDIEREIDDYYYPAAGNINDNIMVVKGIRTGTKMVLDIMTRIL